MFFTSIGKKLNKQSIVLVFFIFISLPVSFGQSWEWAKSAGGVSYDNATKIATDVFGNIYATGYFSSGTINFGTASITNTDSGTADIFLIKYNTSGNVIWAKKAGGVGYDYSQSIATDASGNVYITGNFQSPTILFDTFSLSNTAISTVFIAKYDSTGNVLWAKGSTGNYADYSNTVHTDAFGNAYIAGYFGSSVISFGTYSLANIGGEGMFIVKYDADGNVDWAKSAGGDGLNHALCLTTDVANNIYVCGWFDGTNISFGTDTLVNDSVGTQDIFITKYDTSGLAIWVKSAGGIGNAQATSIVADDSGKVYVAGNFDGRIYLNTDTFTSWGNTDIFFEKLDTAGNMIWAKSEGGSAADYVQAISVDKYNNIYIAGYFSSPTINFGSFHLTNAGGNDVFFARYNYLGNVYGATRSGGVNDDFGQSIASDTAGRVYLAGSFESPTILFATTTLTNAGGSTGLNDIFLAKYYDPIVSVDNNSVHDRNILLFPNPNTGLLTITLPENENIEITIYDCLGSKIFSRLLLGNTNSLKIDIQKYPAGVYYLQTSTNSFNESIPFVINK